MPDSERTAVPSPSADAVAELARAVTGGAVRAVARACRLVDDRRPGYRELLRAIHPHTGRAFWIGVTGNPGAGKSTLVDGLVARFRSEGRRVAVVAVDPTSPFSGGAILGDRIRMQRHFGDSGVFIRSVATRGALGGLSRSTVDIGRVLEASGSEVVLIETVGVGQDELEVMRAVHTTLVVVAPGMGDEIQAIKAGILECGDVFAVNKADRPSADATVRDLELMVSMSSSPIISALHGLHVAAQPGAEPRESTEPGWSARIVKCVATREEGLDELVQALYAHRDWLMHSEAGARQRSRRRREQLLGFLRDELGERLIAECGPALDAAAGRVEAGATDPYAAVEELILDFALRQAR